MIGLTKDSARAPSANFAAICILTAFVVSSLLLYNFRYAPVPAIYDSSQYSSKLFGDLPNDLQSYYGRTSVRTTAERMVRSEQIYQANVAQRRAKVRDIC